MNEAQTQILQVMATLLTKYPHLRFGQLLYIVTDGADLFNIEDGYLLNLLQEHKAHWEQEDV